MPQVRYQSKKLQRRHRILQIGHGKIGTAIASLLAADSRFELTVMDAYDRKHSAGAKYEFVRGDAKDTSKVRALLGGADALISAAPHSLNPFLARLARAAGVHYFDLTESIESTSQIRAIAEKADKAFVPQCGIAPGFICILAAEMVAKFKNIEAVHLRAGCIPQYPSNRLGYMNMWSLDGVVHEYTSTCESILDGQLMRVAPMLEREELMVEGMRLEAFNTSGGLGTLAESFLGRTRALNYKSIRHPGHCEYMRFLLEDCGFNKAPEALKTLLSQNLPTTRQDMMIIYVRARGTTSLGDLVEQAYSQVFRSTGKENETAIEISTAHSLCVMVDLILNGTAKRAGFVRQEQISLAEFFSSPFSGPYQPARSLLET